MKKHLDHYRETKKILDVSIYKELHESGCLPKHTTKFKARIKYKTELYLSSNKETIKGALDRILEEVEGKESVLDLMRETVIKEYFDNLESFLT